MTTKGNRCSKGKSCSATCISRNKKCLIDLSREANKGVGNLRDTLRRMSAAYEENNLGSNEKEKTNESVPFSEWNIHVKGNYGQIAINPEGTRAVKMLLVGPDGKKGEFGEYEIELAKRMGELGHSPRVYSTSNDHIEMDVAKGAPLWRSYSRAEGEPVMNAIQAKQAGSALRAMHEMGFAHGDAHSQQFIMDGNSVKLVDFGLSVPVSRQQSRVMQDLAKINSLVRWDNPELANDPYFALVNKHLTKYRALGNSTSKASNNKRIQIAEAYLRELAGMNE